MTENARGWIQWKGTDVCIDIHCMCGFLSHFDGMFMYHVRCPQCSRVYEVEGDVVLVERGQFREDDPRDSDWNVKNATCD